jgi:hypothetical protein
MSTLITGARTPFFVTDITYYFTLGTGDFSPIEDVPVALTATEEDLYIKNGFVVSNATDTAGYAWCITWDEFQIHRQASNRDLVTNLQVLALCAPVRIYLTAGAWTMTPIVKVYSTGDKSYTSEPAYINVGTIR